MDLLIENRDKLARNPRMAMIYTTLSRMSLARADVIRKQANGLLDVISPAGARMADRRKDAIDS